MQWNQDDIDQPEVCAKLQQILADLDALAAMTPEQRRDVRKHLQSCLDCTEALRAYRRVDQYLIDLAQDPPFELVQLLLNDAAQLPSVTEIEDPLDAALVKRGYRVELDALSRPPQVEAWRSPNPKLGSREDTPPSHQRPHRGRFETDVPAPASDSLLVGVGAESGAHRGADGTWNTGAGPGAQLADAMLLQGRKGRQVLCYEDTPECQVQMGRISGPETCLQAVIEFLERTLLLPVPVSKPPITFTWLLDGEILESGHPLWQDWAMAMRRVLDQGWTVRHLVRVTSNQRKTVRVVEYMRKFLGASGLYDPYLLPAESVWHVAGGDADWGGNGYEFITVPGLGALQLVAPDGRHVTQCRLHSAGARLEALERHVTRVVQSAKRVYAGRYLSPDANYQHAMASIEEYPGARFAVINGLGETTVPPGILEQRAHELRAKGVDETVVATLLALQTKRVHVMERNLKRYPHYDVCPKQAIERLVRNGPYQGIYQTQDSWVALGASRLTPEQIRAHLEFLIKRLESRSNYYLLLLEEENADLHFTEFLAKAGHRAMVEFWLTDAQGQRKRADLDIIEPSIVEALHSPSSWSEMTAHTLSDKAHVLDFLRQQLANV